MMKGGRLRPQSRQIGGEIGATGVCCASAAVTAAQPARNRLDKRTIMVSRLGPKRTDGQMGYEKYSTHQCGIDMAFWDSASLHQSAMLTFCTTKLDEFQSSQATRHSEKKQSWLSNWNLNQIPENRELAPT
jgi:hypothetical protein